MKALSLYSGGCDGLSLAGSWVGIESMAFCECDLECQKQLRRRHPGKPIFTYDTEVTYDALRDNGINPGDIDIILASPPCQCASVAGARLGDTDERNRWPQCLDVVRAVSPRWFVAENVPGLLSVTAGLLFGDILRRLAQMGGTLHLIKGDGNSGSRSVWRGASAYNGDTRSICRVDHHGLANYSSAEAVTRVPLCFRIG